MPLAINRAKLIPASEADTIDPGAFYFACLDIGNKTNPDNYWIVMRAPREWLPGGFFDTRPVSHRVYPFWIIGKDLRIWLPRSSLFYLDRSIRNIFLDKGKKREFTDLAELVGSFSSPQDALQHFRGEIADSTNKYNQRRERIDETVAARRSRSSSLSMDEDSDARPAGAAETPGTSSQATVSSHAEHPPKRQRINHAQSAGSPASGARPTATASPCSRPSTRQATASACIKTEDEERHFTLTQTIREDCRVRIYVGSGNRQCSADISVLQRCSPVLFSLICSSDRTEGMYIMHPKLSTVDTNDFLAVLEFMQTGEYAPSLVNDPGATGSENLSLNGLTTAEQYSEALIRSGRLYVLARMFQVQRMAQLIVRKIKATQSRHSDMVALIALARIVFVLPAPGRKKPLGDLHQPTADEQLDDWIVSRLADNFLRMMASDTERSKYLSMVHATSKREIHAKVLDKAASNYRRLGGLPEVIDDD